MTEEISKILEIEILNNKEVIQIFLNYPREEKEELVTKLKEPKKFISKA